MSNILDEIPYIVKARKDTGLFNSKIAIWLFLASEVMLFGGLFSGYIFLRIYADYPWPERALPVMPGFINTFVLIGSSVTVVFAWAALKMRKYRQFQVYMGITLLCAVGFMVLKTIEYKAKFDHQAVKMADTHAVAEGHFPGLKDEDGNYLKDADGDKLYYKNLINFEATEFTFDLSRYHKPFVKQILAAAEEAGATVTLSRSSLFAFYKAGAEVGEAPQEWIVPAIGSADSGIAPLKEGVEADYKLSLDLLGDMKADFLEAREERSDMSIDALKAAWVKVREDNAGKGLNDRELKLLLEVDDEGVAANTRQPVGVATFVSDKPLQLAFKTKFIQAGEESATLKDSTAVKGKMLDSTLLLAVDTLDFRQTAHRAEERGKDPVTAINNTWLVKENPAIAKIWERHQEETTKLAEDLKEKGQEPNELDLYRISWQEMVYYAGVTDKEPGVFAGFAGPDHYDDEIKEAEAFPVIEIPREKAAFQSNLTPKWNTYYAIYFLMTGLHGLHVIGGAIVLGYFGFFSGKMYREHPEWLANRVEVGGLFWHFVDLVWIFLFPIMYLM